MCKIAVFTNMSKLDTVKTAEVVGKIITQHEKDGYGYAVQGTTGQYGEKSLDPKFRSRLGVTDKITLPIIKQRYDMFGVKSENKGPGIFHGRTSTNKPGLKNCHPMQREGWSLIHNGVVTNEGNRYEKFTDNDSEDVLYHLIQGIEHVENYLSGYYAFAAIDPEGTLHVAKDSLAHLFIAWSSTAETYILGTTAEIIGKIATGLKIKIGLVEEVQDDTYMIFQGNELVASQPINPLGYTSNESQWAERSLGRVIDYSGKGEYPSDTEKPVHSYADSNYLRNEVDKEEEAYYQYKKEIENMDAAYEIYDEMNKPLTVYEFKKLDYIAQEACTIIRPDGTVLDPFEPSMYERAG